MKRMDVACLRGGWLMTTRNRDERGGEQDMAADDEKVARHEQDLAAQLERDISAAGEAGWHSQYYVGSLLYDHSSSYSGWRKARNAWTRTGDISKLREMTGYVDFDNPPGAVTPVARPERRHPVLVTVRFMLPSRRWLVIWLSYLVIVGYLLAWLF
jgi:hypothetical protein